MKSTVLIANLVRLKNWVKQGKNKRKQYVQVMSSAKYFITKALETINTRRN